MYFIAIANCWEKCYKKMWINVELLFLFVLIQLHFHMCCLLDYDENLWPGAFDLPRELINKKVYKWTRACVLTAHFRAWGLF